MSWVVDAAVGRSLLLHSLNKGAGLAHGLDGAESGVLLLHYRLPRLLVLLLQLLVALGEVGEREGGVAIRDGLQDGIVDEGILRL